MSRSSFGLGSLVAVLIVVALGVGTVYAAIPDRNTTYHACLIKATGAVRLLNFPKVSTCPKGERLIAWNAKGPAGPQGAPGAQGAQGPAGPADWNAIPNKPAGFADGSDDVGYVSATRPDTFNAPFGEPIAINVDHPVGTDVALTVIPQQGTNVEERDEYWERNSDGTLRYRLDVMNSDFIDPITFKVRTRIYNTGIAPAAFKKALARVKVTVTKVKRSRSGR